ncbi:hypothetical protein BGX21_000933 [Mortierella sp. AD011]|nr:hypothetical protein BGX20_000886 [Mortierella sp. AD010]KAF9385930.1 hypothetical protein BGX21_000933 [Mortierella sp. AD011]
MQNKFLYILIADYKNALYSDSNDKVLFDITFDGHTLYRITGSHFQKVRFDRRASTIEGVLNIIKDQYPQDDRSKWYIQVEVRRFSKIIKPEDFVRFEMLTDSAYSDEKLINVLLYA